MGRLASRLACLLLAPGPPNLPLQIVRSGRGGTYLPVFPCHHSQRARISQPRSPHRPVDRAVINSGNGPRTATTSIILAFIPRYSIPDAKRDTAHKLQLQFHKLRACVTKTQHRFEPVATFSLLTIVARTGIDWGASITAFTSGSPFLCRTIWMMAQAIRPLHHCYERENTR